MISRGIYHKPRYTVSLLLPMPNQRLQTRYYRHYTVGKKVNDLNHIMIKPGRRESKQMCHINFICGYPFYALCHLAFQSVDNERT